ncbi:putative replication fork protection complex subunit Tof1 Swi1 [Rosellinia necatrix]|uniref:Topoisomerase 1-associated factor 1 n=1 Tax=Rosellinia necatrix TaxID=77044 RepID=A0A1S7ULT3_ROSNE|nr:putative replication fork protection complex subunit Tof1 Swi1 [Rosellinia necatrix]
MEAPDASSDIVHPEVRAHITSLVSALGGFGADDGDEGKYVLGDSALEVLRDIKKWIRFYDEKTNRMDVARCLAEANLVGGDLLHILATWPEDATDNKVKARAALACFEIMVPLTWPLERDLEQMTVNHHRHLPVLQIAQLGYKRAVLNYDAAQILHTAVRVALPSMALSRGDRSARDEGIIKLALLFLRNIAMISPPPGVKYDDDESQISRSALIDAFSFQDILITILTIASNMGEDFNQEGVILMEIIFHLVKRVDVAKLFMDDKQLGKTRANELTAMMSKEAAMHRPYNRKAPSRHNRWGTMIWVDRGDGKISTVTGQDALLDAATRQQKMDSSKVFRPPRRPAKDEMEPRDLGPPVSLNSRARQQLKSFVEEFLDSGFNPLFQHMRKKLDDQKDYVLEYHSRQFFYLVAWFLEVERARKKADKSQSKSPADVGSFNLVAGVLNQEMFITLNRAMADSIESKRWQELCATMRCFTQILLTVQEMLESGHEEDEEIAENILSRIFYEEETHDRVATIAKLYKDQGFEYLDACTELTHTYLRVLEAYSKQNTDMQVRSRRRVRKNKKAAKAPGGDDENPIAEQDESENDQAHAERTTRERKFDFTRFANRFIPQGVVDTFVAFTRYYQDLNDAQLKRAHRYFYRIAFKQEMSVMLFRVDIIQLFYSMVKGQEPLDHNSSLFKEWEELVKQILRKCIRKIEERPQLIIELLFSKIAATAHYLEFGYEKQTLSATQTKPGAELEFRHIVEKDQQIAIAVGVLLDKNLAHHIKWVKEQISHAIEERKAWEGAEKAITSVESSETSGRPEDAPAKEAPPVSVRPDDDTRRTAMFKNSHLRLLMKLVEFERLAPALDETPESAWIVPAHLSSEQLQDSLDLINKAEFDPPTFADGALAQDQLRRKTAPRKKAIFDDDDEGIDNDDDDDILFPAGGPTNRKVADDFLDKPKKTRRRRRRSDATPLTEEQLDEKERSRRERERAKAKRFKSELFVHASDDESDDGERWADFYANEERIRRKQQAVALGTDNNATASAPPTTTGKRKAETLDSGDSDNDDDLILPQGSALERSSNKGAVSDEEDEDASMTDNTALSPGSHAGSVSSTKRRRVTKASSPPASPANADEDQVMEDEDEDIPASKQTQRRPRARAGFLMDSSDEE